MNATMWGLVVLTLFFQSGANSSSRDQQEPELCALQHYVGVWDSQFTIASEEKDNASKSFTGDVEGKWVVGGQFLEQTGQYRLSESASPLIIRTMMSFDKQQQRYQYDYFNSSGGIQRSLGKWDAVAKTMTSRMTDEKDGNITTIVADFSTDGVEHWTIETRNREGKTVLKIVGTNTRRKDK